MNDLDRAIFLDKDGTLINDVPYNVDPDLITLRPGTIPGLAAFQSAGYRLVVVTNQSGVARGLFPESALIGVASRLRELLAEHSIRVDRFDYCPHHPEALVPEYRVDCECRKPAPGMLVRSALALKVSLAESWMIGDRPADIGAGIRAGCRTVLIGNSSLDDPPARERPDLTASDLNAAAQLILSR